MAIFGTSFQIGRSALAAYQSAIAVTGQNIANVGNANYTRQSGRLAALPGGNTLAGVTPGTGVSINTLQRHIDESLESSLRQALSARTSAETTYQLLNRVESLYSELTDYDLSTQLSTLYGSFTNLQTDPLEMGSRDIVLSEAEAVASTLQRYRSSLLDSVVDLNDTAEAIALNANDIVDEIATLNEQIVISNARGSGGDSALQDRRDALLRDLSTLMDIQTRMQDNGVVNVYVGSEPLVEFNRSRGIQASRTLENGVERVELQFADNGGSITVRDGQLGAVIEAAGGQLPDQVSQLDELARGLIYELNRAHSTGMGLHGYDSLTGAYQISDPNAVLTNAAAGLNFPVQNGTFLVHIRDKQSGQATTKMIQVDLDGLDAANDTSLASLVKDLNDVPGLSASVTLDNRLHLDADPAYEVSFSDDTSGALAALGVGVFFEGTDAGSIAVSSTLKNDPSLLATSLSGAPNDGSNAGLLANAGSVASSLLGGLSVQDYQQTMTSKLAVTTASAMGMYEANDAIYSSLLAQRESISGVNLDEEAINLSMYERSFQGAARYLTVVEDLSATVLSLVS